MSKAVFEIKYLYTSICKISNIFFSIYINKLSSNESANVYNPVDKLF